MTGTSGPIDADGNGPQRARQASSSMGIGREGAICEEIDIMCKSPRFERRCAAYRCIADVLQYRDSEQFRSELEIQKFQPLPHPEQRDRQRQRGNQRPCTVRPPSQQGRRLRRAAVFAVAKQLWNVGHENRDHE